MMMSREQKIEWLASASNEAVVDQMKWAVTMMNGDSISTRIEGKEDYDLVTAEILRRMK